MTVKDLMQARQQPDRLSWCLTGCALLVGFTAVIGYVVDIPRYSTMFQDLELNLGLMTAWVISLGTWGALLVALAPGATGAALTAIFPPGPSRILAGILGLTGSLMMLVLLHLSLRTPVAEVTSWLDGDTEAHQARQEELLRSYGIQPGLLLWP